MGVYVGYVEKKGYEPTVFFNFTPIAEIRDSQIIELTFEGKSELLPESEKGNINFTYSWNDDKDKQRMDATFREKALVIFEFTLSDLEDNFKTNGDRNQTGYKVQAIEMIDTGKIRPIDSENIYYIALTLNKAYDNGIIDQEKLDEMMSNYWQDFDQIENPISLTQKQYDEVIKLLNKLDSTKINVEMILNKIVVSE